MKIYNISNYLLSIVILLITTSTIFAQNNPALKDIVHLKDGSIIKGHITNYEPNKKIIIEIEGGNTLVYSSSDVLKIEETESSHSKYKSSKLPHRPTYPNLYHSISIGTSLALNRSGVGLDMNTTTGWYFHRLFGIGIGVGVNNLGGNLFVPIYTNIKGDFMKSSTSLFYNVDIGYGIGVNLYGFNPSSIKKFQGGFYARPAIGIRFPSTRKTHLFMDLGCIIQNLHVEFDNTSPFSQIFYNLSLRVGVSF